MLDTQTPLPRPSLQATPPKNRVLQRADFLPLTQVAATTASLQRAYDKRTFGHITDSHYFQEKVAKRISDLHSHMELLVTHANIAPHLDGNCIGGLRKSVAGLSSDRLRIDPLVDISERVIWQTHRIRRRFLADLLLHPSETTAKSAEDPHIRWMIEKDYPGVMEIECESCENPWEVADVSEVRCKRNGIGMLAELCGPDDPIGGFFLYELYKDHIRLRKIDVDPAVRRKGIGSAIIERLKRKLTPYRRQRLVMEIHEGNVPALAFLRANDFIRATTFRRHAPDGGDVHRMEYTVPEAMEQWGKYEWE